MDAPSKDRPSLLTKTGEYFYVPKVQIGKLAVHLPLSVSSLFNFESVCRLSSVSTILVEPSCEARLTQEGDVCLTVGLDQRCVLGTELNTVQLSIFSHRFMSIAGTPRLRNGETTTGCAELS